MSKYDLLYLSNHIDFKKVKTNVCDQNLTEDIKFYEERIMQQTKILLYNNPEEVTLEIKDCFNKYLCMSIENFKFIDKRDIIQKDYENIKEKMKEELPFNLENTNKMLEKFKQKTGKLTDILNIKIKNTSEKKIIYPKMKILNLKDDKFKRKGLVKKEYEHILVENNVKKDKKNEKDKKEENTKKSASKKKTERKKERKNGGFSKKIYK